MNRTPRLRSDVVIVEQTYRGQQSYVVKDLESQKYYRFRPVEVIVMRALDGVHTCGEVAAGLRAEGLGVSEAVVEGFAQKLNRMGLIERSLAERSTLQLERLRAERNRRAQPKLFRGEVTRMRWSMGDPNAAFDRWLPRLRFLFSREFLILSVALFAVNLGMMAITWPKFHAALSQLTNFSAFTPAHAVLFWLTVLGVVFVHELGHGFTCKYFGGEVHEMGFMLVYFQPAFYANVNDAWTFPELKARLWVTAAGVWIAGVVATLAGLVWWIADPGTLLSQVALLAFIFGGAFSVLTNANPLIPLDGYFALSDYLEVPNLRHRAFAHLEWLIRRHLLRLDLPMPASSERERRIFLIYGLCSAAYLTVILSVVAMMVVRRAGAAFGLVGTLISVGLILLMLRGKIRSWAAAVRLSIREHRATLESRPVRLWIGGGALALLLLLTVVPWSITVTGPFLAAPARAAPLVAPDSGYVARVLVREGATVAAGTPLIRLRDFDLERAALAERRAVDSLTLLESRARAGGDAGETERIARVRAVAEARLASSSQRIAALALRASQSGVVLTARPELLTGQWINAGQTVLMLGQPDSVEVRIRLRGSGATLVRPGQRVEMLSLADVAHPVRGTVASVSRAAVSRDEIEARVRLPAQPAWRPGAGGAASVVIRRSNIAGALWWAMRKRVRSDILL
ncbi:MAG: HlyD family efflux transporter periplasmic adaptor subunit [Bacillota bacterium]|jgi:biotin carboxyl carrier protein